MKRFAAGFALVLGLLVLSCVPQTVLAATTETTTTNTAAKTTLSSRVQERRDRLQTKLAPAETTRQNELCAGAQSKAQPLVKRLTDSYTPYQDKLANYIKHLNELSATLEKNGTDVTELKSQIATLQQKQDAYKAALDQLTVSLTDLTTMNCKSEPNGFKATLEDVRAQAKAIRVAYKDVQMYAKDTVKATLQQIKDGKKS